MRYLFSLIISLLILPAIGQNCKIEVDNVDPRTKMRVIRTDFEQFSKVNNNPFLVKAQSVGEQRFLKIRYYRYNGFQIKPGSNLEFTLEDNSTVTLVPFINPADTVSDENSFMTVSSLIIYPVEPDAYQKLKNLRITMFKYYREEGYVTREVKEKNQEVIRDLLRCVEGQ